jgi:hypothetical protein
VLTGALLVLAMTIGYVSTDRLMARRTARRRDRAGPNGGPPDAT